MGRRVVAWRVRLRLESQLKLKLKLRRELKQELEPALELELGLELELDQVLEAGLREPVPVAQPRQLWRRRASSCLRLVLLPLPARPPTLWLALRLALRLVL